MNRTDRSSKEQGTLLSICVPTYKRDRLLLERINEIVGLVPGGLQNIVEIVVLGNSPLDIIELNKAVIEWKGAFHIVEWKKNCGGDENFLRAYEYASSKFTWIIGDDDYLLDIKSILQSLSLLDPDILYVPYAVGDKIYKGKTGTYRVQYQDNINGNASDFKCLMGEYGLSLFLPSFIVKTSLVGAHLAYSRRANHCYSCHIALISLACGDRPIQIAENTKVCVRFGGFELQKNQMANILPIFAGLPRLQFYCHPSHAAVISKSIRRLSDDYFAFYKIIFAFYMARISLDRQLVQQLHKNANHSTSLVYTMPMALLLRIVLFLIFCAPQLFTPSFKIIYRILKKKTLPLDDYYSIS